MNLNSYIAKTMTKRELIDFCLSFPGVFEDYPFDETTAIMKHSGNKKMFAAIDELRTGKLYISLKCEPMKADFLRNVYQSIEPAWHFNKMHWNGITVDGDVPEFELHNMIWHSFDLTKPRIKRDKGVYNMNDNTQQQLLRDANTTPTDEIIVAGLGKAYKSYAQFIEELKTHGISLMDWRFYNDGKAWLTKGEYKWTTARGTQKVKPIFWLSIWDGFFKVSFFFSTDLRAELQSLEISDETKELIANAKPMGKTMRILPIIIDIRTKKQLNDIYAIAAFRKVRVK